MEADEDGTYLRLMELREELIEPTIACWRGTIVKHTGDGFLASFDDVLDAVSCAVALQRSLSKQSVGAPAAQSLDFRMGLNLSEAIVSVDDIFGDGVNIASRLQSYAEPGGIVVPAAIAEKVEGRHGLRRVDLGDLHLKNIKRPVRAVSLELIDSDRSPDQLHRRPVVDGRPSIAVLPFRKHVVAEHEGYFADGIVDEIISALSSVKDLVVIARGSTLGFGGERVDVRAVGRELGARYVLDGGVSRSGGRIRITAELFDATSGAVIWAERYNGVIAELFDLQDRIALQVVATLAPQVREHELKRVLRKHPDSMDSYDFVLQAIDLLHRMEYRPFSGARGLLQQARVYDDGYAPAWTYAAEWHIFRIGQGWSPDVRADSLEAERLAMAALDRDHDDASALAVCGHARSFLFHDYTAGRELVDRAIEAGPSCALAWTLASCTCSYMGDGAEAVARAEHSLRLSPRDPLAFFYLCNMGIAHYANHAYEQAVQFARKSMARKKSFRANLRMLIAGLVALDELNEARDVARMLTEVDPEFRLSSYRSLCPWQDGHVRDLFIDHLRCSGLAE
jgi:adenylate cyclase